MRNQLYKIMLEIVAINGNPALKIQLQEKISQVTGVDYKSVYRWLHNRNQPRLEHMHPILEVLREYKPHLSMEDLIERHDPEVKSKFNLVK